MRYAFADCELDITRHRLLRTGQEVHVEPQVFTLIACLAAAGYGTRNLQAGDDLTPDIEATPANPAKTDPRSRERSDLAR